MRLSRSEVQSPLHLAEVGVDGDPVGKGEWGLVKIHGTATEVKRVADTVLGGEDQEGDRNARVVSTGRLPASGFQFAVCSFHSVPGYRGGIEGVYLGQTKAPSPFRGRGLGEGFTQAWSLKPEAFPLTTPPAYGSPPSSPGGCQAAGSPPARPAG